MKNIFQILLPLAILTSCSGEKKKTEPFTFPPEWEPQQAVWLSIHDRWELNQGANQIDTRLELVKILHQYVPVKILTYKDSLANAFVGSLLQMKVDTSRVTMIVHPQETYFMRDPGPLFLSNDLELRMANWQGIDSNSVKRISDVELRKTVDDSLAIRFGHKVQNSPLSYDGGAIEVNSESAMSIKDFAMLHNQGEPYFEEIEREILDMYGKKQMIWLEGVPLIEKNGLKIENYWGYAPNGHIDAVARFANDSTILVTTISEGDKDKNPIASYDYEIFQGYLDQIKKQRRTNGKPFTIIEVPSPDLNLHLLPLPISLWSPEGLEELYNEGLSKETEIIQVVPALSYANYFVTNGAVLVAQYWEEGMPESEKEKDQKMVSILKNCFPNREIIGFKAKEINLFGGGIHCVTQQEPRIN
ncbi:agmatine deiminase family protein [Flagellimonas sp.]|uniref:agmatine deiminase family protein n=1 Tax=Flagellimonas sp. TaxID=2058762 RepID=UPI003F49CE63